METQLPVGAIERMQQQAAEREKRQKEAENLRKKVEAQRIVKASPTGMDAATEAELKKRGLIS